MLIIADQCTLAIHINDSEHMSRYVGSSHALTNTIHEEEKISSTRLQHSNLANQSEISIILCQPIRRDSHLHKSRVATNKLSRAESTSLR